MQHWFQFLRDRHAVIENGRVSHFTDPARERMAARDGEVLMDLSQYALVQVTGDDRVEFLHGQLTNDLKALDQEHWQLHAWCTAKGRSIALLQIVSGAEPQHYMLAERDLSDGLVRRLNMYRLRARVQFDLLEGWTVLGLAGPASSGLLTAAGLPVPTADRCAARADSVTVLRHGGLHDRFQLLLPAGAAPQIWDQLAAGAMPVGSDRWDWLNIVSGIPRVTGATTETFVPQMLNLDLLDGISFKKGCFPGQEIVARTRYLGKLKSRMVLARVEAGESPAPGTRIHAQSFGDQAAGTVVDGAPAPDGGYDLLAVVQLSTLGNDTLRLATADGPALSLQELPYPLPQDS